MTELIANGESGSDVRAKLNALASGTLIDSGWVDISSIDILALKTTEKVIVPAQGANTIIALIEIHLSFTPGNAAYTGGTRPKVFYAGGVYNGEEYMIDFRYIFSESTDQYTWGLTAQEAWNYLEASKAINKAIVIKIDPDGDPLADGNGTAKARAFYRTIDVS